MKPVFVTLLARRGVCEYKTLKQKCVDVYINYKWDDGEGCGDEKLKGDFGKCFPANMNGRMSTFIFY